MSQRKMKPISIVGRNSRIHTFRIQSKKRKRIISWIYLSGVILSIVDDEIGIQFVSEIKSFLRIKSLRVACIKVHAYRV